MFIYDEYSIVFISLDFFLKLKWYMIIWYIDGFEYNWMNIHHWSQPLDLWVHCVTRNRYRVIEMICSIDWMRVDYPISPPSCYCFQTPRSYWIGLLMWLEYAFVQSHLLLLIGVQIHQPNSSYYHPYPWTRTSIDQIDESSVYRFLPPIDNSSPRGLQ